MEENDNQSRIASCNWFVSISFLLRMKTESQVVKTIIFNIGTHFVYFDLWHLFSRVILHVDLFH